ncbi:MAG TPA: Uma2 family endonuclease [Polyangiaceae bacterium]|jgi:Uma2 family endonuclease
MASPSIEQLRPLRRAEYDQLVALRAFKNERIELIDGALVRMSPIGPSHNDTVGRLMELLVLACAGKARVFAQGPFAAGDLSEPEPDLSVVPLGDYSSQHPVRAHLIVEVAESSLASDRGRKARLYAECLVPEYWVVNLSARTVEVHTQPSQGSYARVIVHSHEASIRLCEFPELAVRVCDFLK